MAKRRSKQDVGAKQDAPRFDYSPAEWSNIEEPIRAIGKSLPNEVRELLVGYARLYPFEIRLQTLAKGRRDWQTIARLCERLYQAVSAQIQKDQEILRDLEEPLKGVLRIKKWATGFAASRERNQPVSTRERYQLLVLDLWVELGGKLQSARHPKTGRPQGPLIRFFQAVTNPVMGASAYSLESLPAIIRQAKRVRAQEELIRQCIAKAPHDPAQAEILRKLRAISPEMIDQIAAKMQAEAKAKGANSAVSVQKANGHPR